MLVLFGLLAKEVVKIVDQEMQKKKINDNERSIQEFLEKEDVSPLSYSKANNIISLHRENCCSTHISRVLKVPKREVEAIISRFVNSSNY